MNAPPGRNLFQTFAPGQWRPCGPAAPGELEAQVIRRTITPAEPGWIRCQVWRYLEGEPAPELLRVEVLVELLPEEARP